MNRRILCASDGVPAWGDANPWAYGLHQWLRDAGYEAGLVHLLTEPDACFFRHLFGNDSDDPYRIGGVQRCIIEAPSVQRQAALAEMIDAFAPDLLVAWGITAARVLRGAAPTLPLALMATHCAGLEALIDAGAVRDFLGFRAAVERGVIYPHTSDGPELDAFAVCDLAVAPSSLARLTYEHLYRTDAGKLYARPIAPAELAEREAERFAGLRRPFDRRDIDVLFVAGSWEVPARNLRLTQTLCAALRSLNVHVVGECGRSLPARTHGAVPRRPLYELLGRSKVAVFPGLADAAPGGMFEASAMGCNVVASPDCGFWELCHDDLRVPAPSAAPFLDRIEVARARPLADQRERFRGDTADLVETLAVF